jgi:hypothetical protein
MCRRSITHVFLNYVCFEWKNILIYIVSYFTAISINTTAVYNEIYLFGVGLLLAILHVIYFSYIGAKIKRATSSF